MKLLALVPVLLLTGCLEKRFTSGQCIIDESAYTEFLDPDKHWVIKILEVGKVHYLVERHSFYLGKYKTEYPFSKFEEGYRTIRCPKE